MIDLPNVLIPLLCVAGAISLSVLYGRRRRMASARAKAEQIANANRPLNVWVCRHCGSMNLMRALACNACQADRPDTFVYRTITVREFKAQLQAPAPEPHASGSSNAR